MAEAVETVAIAGPSEQVWAMLADFGEISRWAPNVDHSCLTTEQAEGVGCVRRVQIGRSALLEQVVQWEAGERLAYAIQGLPPVVRSAVNTWTVEADEGSTTVTLTTQVDAGPRPPQQAVARVIGKAMAKASRQMLDGLKAHIESDGDRATHQEVSS
jgi:carbon monoxide dehydrogenase subunit G